MGERGYQRTLHSIVWETSRVYSNLSLLSLIILLTFFSLSRWFPCLQISSEYANGIYLSAKSWSFHEMILHSVRIIKSYQPFLKEIVLLNYQQISFFNDFQKLTILTFRHAVIFWPIISEVRIYNQVNNLFFLASSVWERELVTYNKPLIRFMRNKNLWREISLS